MNKKVTVAKFPENGVRTQMPTRPAKRRIAIHVFSIDNGACIQKQLDCLFAAKSSGTMQGSFGLRPDVSHEAPCFRVRPCHTIWIRTVRDQYLDDKIVGGAICLAQRRVQPQ